MAKKRKQRELTQAELWDDTALIRSWDEAVEEYKRYHSIHAKGEDVEDGLRLAEDEVLMIEGKDRRDIRIMTDAGDGTVEEERADGSSDADSLGEYTPLQAMVTIEDRPAVAYASEESIPHDMHSSSVALPSLEELQSTGKVQGELLAGGGDMPHSVLENVKDESLKSLMMAWYFAGYYTGLREGQRGRETIP